MLPAISPPAPRWQLRWTLPGALFCALGVAGLLGYLALASRAEETVVAEAREHLQDLAALEARNLGLLLDRGAASTAAQLLAGVEVERSVDGALLVDAENLIVASTRAAEIGQTFPFTGFEPDAAGVSRRQIGSRIWASAAVAGRDQPRDRAYRLVLDRDLQPGLADAHRQVRATVFWNLLYFALVCGLLAAFVNARLVRRLRRLGNAFAVALGGQTGVSLPVGPADEVGVLVQQFNAATRFLDETRATNQRLLAALAQLAQPDPDFPVFDAIARSVALGLESSGAVVLHLAADGQQVALLGQWGMADAVRQRVFPLSEASRVLLLADPEAVPGLAVHALPAASGDPLLTAIGARRFSGVALRTASGTILGSLLALDPAPAREASGAESLLSVAARRATQELARAEGERELEAQRAQLELAMQTGELAVWVWRDDSGFSVGPAWSALFDAGSTNDAAFSHATRVHPDDLARVEARFKAHLDGQTDIHHCEFRLRDGRGEWRRVIEQGRIIERDAAGRPLRALGIHKDITRVAQLETDLLARTEFLELAARGSMDGLWDWDIAGNRLYTSPRLAELLGYEPGSLPSTPEAFVAQVQDPAEFASPEALLALNKAGASYLKRDFRLRTRAGHWRWFDVRAALVRDESGQIVRMVGSMSDIEERRQREAELAEARQMLVESIESLDSGLLRLDAEDRVVFCNSSYRALYGYAPDEPLEGLAFRDLVRIGFERHGKELQGRSLDEAVAQRMASHRRRSGAWEIQLAAIGRWVLASDRPTRDGGVVSLRTDITAQKLLEVTLKDRTELLELAMRGSEAGLWDWEAEGDTLSLSERFGELLGFESPVFTASIADFIEHRCHPDERRTLLRWLRKVTVDPRQGEVFGRELRLLCADLSWRWFHIRAAVIRNAEGRVVRVAGSLVDAHARKSWEVELAEARQHLHDAVESLDAGLAMYDAGGRLLFCNAPFQTIFAAPGVRFQPGLTLEETLRRGYAALPAPPEGMSERAFLRYWMDLLKPAVGLREVQIGERWFQIHDFPTQGHGIVSLRTETTAIRRAEQALRESEARLRTVFEGSPVGIFLADAGGNVRYANGALTELLGVDRLPETQAQWMALIHPQDRPSVGVSFQTYLAAPEGNLRIELRLATPEERPRQVYMQIRPVLEAGRLLGFAATLEDVSERRRQEAAQRQLQAQLQQAQKMEAIGQLTGGVAHDFNNILASVLGYATLATMRPQVNADPKLQEYLAAVVAAGERARDLVAKMLAFSRSRPAEPQALVPLPTLPLLNEVVTLLRSLIPANHQLVTDFAPALPPLLIDGVDLHQAVINLAINARDAIEEQGRIAISARPPRRFTGHCASCRAALDADYLEIAVSDTGNGIPAELLPRVFDPFFSTREVGKGTGMGLAVTHGVVHGAGGHVLLESQPGQGTTVRLLLPTTGPAGTAQPGVTPVPATAEAHGRPTLLVLDDEPSMAEMWREVFTAEGYAVETFADPAAALAWVLSPAGGCDLVLTDQTMPGMTGLEFARALLARRPETPVILCTGLDGGVDTQLANAVGVTGVYVKPVPIERMCTVVKEALGRARRSSE